MDKFLRKDLFFKSKLKGIRERFCEFQSEIICNSAVLLISLVLIYFLTRFILPEKENLIDTGLFMLIRHTVNPAELKAARMLTILGTGNFLIPAYLVIVIYLEKKNYRCLGYLTAITAISALLLGWILKWIFRRERPLEHLVNGAGGYSFPSGHALGGFIFCGIVLYLLWNTRHAFQIKWLFSVMIVLLGFCIGLSRIYLHVHYATDVLGSLFIAIGWLFFLHILFRLTFGNRISKIRKYDPVFFPSDYYLNN